MRRRYETNIYVFLSLLRFFAYGLAVLLIQTIPSDPSLVGFQTYLLLVSMGIYTVVKVLGPLRWWDKDPMTYLVLTGDLVVSILAVLLTGGLTSGFLLYSFLPVLTAALLFGERLALTAAAVTPLALIVAHTVGNQWSDSLTWVMHDNLLLWLIFSPWSASSLPPQSSAPT